MKYWVIILLILFLNTIAIAEIDNRTAWDGWHILGSYVLTDGLNRLGYSWHTAAGVTFLAGLSWEILDEFKQRGITDNEVFDEAGFSSNDIKLDVIGILCTFPGRKKCKILLTKSSGLITLRLLAWW